MTRFWNFITGLRGVAENETSCPVCLQDVKACFPLSYRDLVFHDCLYRADNCSILWITWMLMIYSDVNDVIMTSITEFLVLNRFFHQCHLTSGFLFLSKPDLIRDVNDVIILTSITAFLVSNYFFHQCNLTSGFISKQQRVDSACN